MPRNANPTQVTGCHTYSTEMELVDDVHRTFTHVHKIEAQKSRTFVHPFENPLTALGTTTLSLELCKQADELDAVVVPIDGGDLCTKIATTIKQRLPHYAIYGMKPEDADNMHRSFAAGSPQGIDKM